MAQAKTVTVTQGNALALDFVLYGKDGTPAPLEGVTYRVTLALTSRRSGGQYINGRVVDVIAGVPGGVRVQVTAADTATVDSYLAQFTAYYLDGVVQSFPDDGYLILTVIKAA